MISQGMRSSFGSVSRSAFFGSAAFARPLAFPPRMGRSRFIHENGHFAADPGEEGKNPTSERIPAPEEVLAGIPCVGAWTGQAPNALPRASGHHHLFFLKSLNSPPAVFVKTLLGRFGWTGGAGVGLGVGGGDVCC